MAVDTGLLPPRYIGPQLIGRGGMGEIFRATDTSLGRAVAVKVLDERYAQDASVRERFTREALAVARLSGNPHIVTIYDVGEHRERPFIVMEYLAGGSLQEKLSGAGRPSARQSLEWLEQAASAIDAAHREGVVHRDVKPANLLLDRHGRIHVADFGIASAAGLGSLTQTGTVLGTASYLSPEQAKGEPTSPASDLYSFGVVAFELLTGHRPFEADSVAAEAAQHVTGVIPSVTDVDPALPRQLDPVFAKALAKDPAARYESAAEFVAALRASLDEAAGTTNIVGPPTAPTRVRAAPPRRRRPAWLVPLVGLLLAAGAGGGVAGALLGGGDKKSTKPPPPARPSVSVKTVTQPGTTVVTTAPAPAPPTTTAAAAATTTAAASGDPVALNDQAWSLMKQGDYEGALPLLESAVGQLQGRGDLTEAYASYNLGVTLTQLGRCDEALPYLDRSWELQRGRHEVKQAIHDARKCAGGD